MTKTMALLGATMLAAGLSAPASAAAVLIGTGGPNDCIGGFSTCYANEDGTITQDQGDSPAIYKLNSGGDDPEEFSSLFPSIDGSEFDINYDGGTNTLSFTYTPGVNDPDIHFFTLKQGRVWKLFHDADPILSGSYDLDTYFPNNPGWSHITFFDTGSAVPEPTTWALMILGFGVIGGVMRRKQRQSVSYKFA